jgi:hypothetical protein
MSTVALVNNEESMTRDKEKPAQIAWEYITWRLRATQTN